MRRALQAIGADTTASDKAQRAWAGGRASDDAACGTALAVAPPSGAGCAAPLPLHATSGHACTTANGTCCGCSAWALPGGLVCSPVCVCCRGSTAAPGGGSPSAEAARATLAPRPLLCNAAAAAGRASATPPGRAAAMLAARGRPPARACLPAAGGAMPRPAWSVPRHAIHVLGLARAVGSARPAQP